MNAGVRSSNLLEGTTLSNIFPPPVILYPSPPTTKSYPIFWPKIDYKQTTNALRYNGLIKGRGTVRGF
jgi:hypothetical protein